MGRDSTPAAELTIIVPSDDLGRAQAGVIAAAIRGSGAQTDCRIQPGQESAGLRLSDAGVAAARSAGRALLVPPPDDRLLGQLRSRLGLWTSVTPRHGTADAARGERVRLDLRLVRDHHDDVTRGPAFGPASDWTRWLPAILGTAPSAVILPADAAVAVSCRSPARTERFLHAACRDALAAGRHKITIVHKGNALKSTDGVLHQVAQRVAAQPRWSHLAFEALIVDNMCAELVQRPQAYDVLVAPALYGDMMEAIISGLLGPMPVGQTWHGEGVAVYSGRPSAHQGFAVLGSLRAAAYLLHDAGWAEPARRLDKAVQAVGGSGTVLTLTAASVAQAVLARLAAAHDGADA